MMKDPWKVLEIQPTTDLDVIKKAYRALAQKYHPDKAKTPEKQRKYTVRFVEIRHAYEAALKYAQNQAATSGRTAAPPVSGSPAGSTIPWQEWVKGALILAGGVVGILLLAVTAKYALSSPETLFRISLNVSLGISAGCIASIYLFIFLMMFYMPIVSILEKLGVGKYTDKLGWVLSFMLWVTAISHIGVSISELKQSSNATIWFVGFGVGLGASPVFWLGTWVVDYIKYRKVKNQYLSVIVNHDIQPVIKSHG